MAQSSYQVSSKLVEWFKSSGEDTRSQQAKKSDHRLDVEPTKLITAS